MRYKIFLRKHHFVSNSLEFHMAPCYNNLNNYYRDLFANERCHTHDFYQWRPWSGEIIFLYRLGFKVGEPVFVYRKYTGNQGSRGYKSCITTYCIATRIETIKNAGRALMTYEQYRHIVGNKSVFDDQQLRAKYDTLTNLTLIELLYYGYFGAGNNVNWVWLKDNGCWPETHPMNFRYTRDQIDRILRRGNIDVENVIIN